MKESDIQDDSNNGNSNVDIKSEKSDSPFESFEGEKSDLDIEGDSEDVMNDAPEFAYDKSESIRGNDGISDIEAPELMRDDYGDFHQGIIDNSEVIEEYDVNEYASIQILHNPYINEKLYRIVEPKLNDLEKRLRIKVSRDISEEFESLPVETMNEDEIEEKVREMGINHLNKQKSILSSYTNKTIRYLNDKTQKLSQKLGSERFGGLNLSEYSEITDENIDRVLYYLKRDFALYEKLTPIMDDQNVEDISCNGSEKPVFLYHKVHRDVITNLMYEKDELDEFVSSLAQKSGKHISIAEPDMQGRLPGGSRVQLTYSDEISDDGSNFTIRQFKDEPFTPVDLIEYNTFSLDQMAYLWISIENERSLIFAGGTASGKTSSMNAISLFIPPRSKVVSIEDTREITLRHSNWIKSVTRESFGGGSSGEVDMYDLLRDALRQRPEYIIVGEIRGKEARTLFQAMSTGHTTYSTMHADDVESTIRRLENDPINLPRQMLSSLDILSIQTRLIDDGDIMRRCKEMVEIVDVKSGSNEIVSQTTFEYEPSSDNIIYKGNSYVMEEIKNIRNWSDEDLNKEIQRRKKVLKYLIEETDVRDYEVISSVLRTYMQDKSIVLDQIDDNTLLKGR